MELSTEPTFLHVTWIVKDFLELSQERGSFLESPEFLFSDETYCLRLYPRGTITVGDRTVFHVRRISAAFSRRKVSCDIGIRTREPNGDERYKYLPKLIVRSGSESIEENRSYPRSRIERFRDEYVPDGSFTVVCKLWLSEESRAGSSDRGEEERGGHSALVSSRWSSSKVELKTEFPCTQVKLCVPDVFELLRATGDSLSSPEFLFAGDTYCFRLHPNGATADADLDLVRLTCNLTEYTVLYRVGYRGRWGCPTHRYNSRPLVGCRVFCLSLSKLDRERNRHAPDGTLRLFLFLHLGERSSDGADTSDVTREWRRLIEIEKLQSDLRQLRKKGTESDACFVVRGKEFPVHRNVLRARSAVFEAMFDHDTAENRSGRVVVDDLDPDTFGEFLEYLYSGDVQDGLSDENVFGLYIAADKYDTSTLRSKCMHHMCRTLSVDSFCDVLTFVQHHHEEQFLEHATNFFRENLERIIRTAKWQQFMGAYPVNANELLRRANEPRTQ